MQISKHRSRVERLVENKISIFIRSYLSEAALITGKPETIQTGQSFTLRMPVTPETWPIRDVGFQIEGSQGATGEIQIVSVTYQGKPQFTFPDLPHLGPAYEPIGWISDVDRMLVRPFPSDPGSMVKIGKDHGSGIMVTGTRDWTDYTWEATMHIHLAKRTGLLVRYQGLRRYIALLKTAGTLQLVKQHYEVSMAWKPDEDHHLRLACVGKKLTVWCDEGLVFVEEDLPFLCGGAGYYVEEGLCGFRSTTVQPL